MTWWLRRNVCVVAFISLVVCGLSAVFVSAAHKHWIDHYRNAEGSPCCGMSDCPKIPVRIVAFEGQTTVVELGSTGEYGQLRMASGSVHHSEDQSSYVCVTEWNGKARMSAQWVRCVFYAVGS